MQRELGHSKWAALLEGVLFYGDPHGVWDPLMKAIDSDTREVIILGDLTEAKRDPGQVDAARQALVALADQDVSWWMISGNHDTDTAAIHDLVYSELSEHLLDDRVMQTSKTGAKIAGLGGVVRGRVWDGRSEPNFASPEALLEQTPKSARYRGGLPFRQRSTVFPSSVSKQRAERADVLVCHEAPSCNTRGFNFIDRLAKDMGAGLIVHGHHHVSYESALPNGVRVKGLGLAEVWKPEFDLPPRQKDLLRAGLDALAGNEAAYRLLKSR